MSRLRTLVEVELGAYDKEGNPKFHKVDGSDDEVQVIEVRQYYMLHWGLKMTSYEVEGVIYMVNYTVGILQDKETGEVNMFSPDEIKIIGTEIPEEK